MTAEQPQKFQAAAIRFMNCV